MRRYDVLILTDHRGHSYENSVYAICTELLKNPQVSIVHIATRGNINNDCFFLKHNTSDLWVTEVSSDFKHTPDGQYFHKTFKANISNYDLVWLRLPPPFSSSFADFLANIHPHPFFINNPKGICTTGGKDFLLNFQSVAPTMKMCYSIQDIKDFKQNFPIVLKPLKDYGAKGIIKLENNKVWDNNQEYSFDEWIQTRQKIEYLGVRYLKNVSEGDKRIIVVDGKIMGASLRIPKQGSWLCNISMGGTAVISEVSPEEQQIVETINPLLSQMGIVMYGVDTLMDDNGKRVLSEINTTSIGGLPQMGIIRNEPLLEAGINLIINYFIRNKNNGKIHH